MQAAGWHDLYKYIYRVSLRNVFVEHDKSDAKLIRDLWSVFRSWDSSPEDRLVAAAGMLYYEAQGGFAYPVKRYIQTKLPFKAVKRSRVDEEDGARQDGALPGNIPEEKMAHVEELMSNGSYSDQYSWADGGLQGGNPDYVPLKPFYGIFNKRADYKYKGVPWYQEQQMVAKQIASTDGLVNTSIVYEFDNTKWKSYMDAYPIWNVSSITSGTTNIIKQLVNMTHSPTDTDVGELGVENQYFLFDILYVTELKNNSGTTAHLELMPVQSVSTQSTGSFLAYQIAGVNNWMGDATPTLLETTNPMLNLLKFKCKETDQVWRKQGRQSIVLKPGQGTKIIWRTKLEANPFDSLNNGYTWPIGAFQMIYRLHGDIGSNATNVGYQTCSLDTMTFQYFKAKARFMRGRNMMVPIEAVPSTADFSGKNVDNPLTATT